MTLLEAARQALEALEQLQGGCTDSDDGTVEAITVWCPEVIDALRQAIAEAEQHAVNTSQERVDEMVKTEHDKQIELAQAYERGWNAALAQQEPVAHIDHRIHGWPDCFVIRADPPHTSPLYTAPPQRQPLTDEHILLIANRLWEIDIPSDSSLWFARAIESAHGIGEKV